MSEFSTEQAAAIDEMQSIYGESVTITPSGGSANTITAIVVRQAPMDDARDDGQWRVYKADVICDADDVSNPAQTDVLNFPVQAGGTAEDWGCESEPDVQFGRVVYRVGRFDRIEITAQGYRRET